jgi:thiol-disulfide isomerase/thioredoxin
MALTPSTMVPLGTPAQDFALPEPRTGGTVLLGDCAGRPLLVMFICNHCPYVIHVQPELRRLDRDYGDRLAIVAINSNSLRTHPQDGPGHMAALATEQGWRFPFLFDEDQSVARAYNAACTPDFFVYDANHTLFYRGQLDDSRPNMGKPDGRDLRDALDALLIGADPPGHQMPSAGCNIKWHPA